MKWVNGVFALAAVVLLANCSNGLSPPEMLNRAQPVGSPYTQYLAVQYQTLANSLSGADEVYFAKKGLAAVDGVLVMPESLAGRDLSNADAADMAESRGALMAALENGGRDRAPDIAAVAQTRFDCWITHQGGLWRKAIANFPGEDVSCKDQFHAAMSSLQQALAAAPPPANMPAPAQPPSEEFPSPITSMSGGAEVSLQQAAFLVFFDWNKYNISPSGRDVLDRVAREIEGRNDIRKIIVDGYTDTSGGEKYNMKLSLERANAVRKVLISHGIPAKKIKVAGHGKTDLLVKTPDGVREPQNRRAQISFE